MPIKCYKVKFAPSSADKFFQMVNDFGTSNTYPSIVNGHPHPLKRIILATEDEITMLTLALEQFTFKEEPKMNPIIVQALLK